MKKIGKRNAPNMMSSLKKYIAAEEKREAEAYKRLSVRQFCGNEWGDYDDEYYGEDFYGSRPWWADYGVEDNPNESNDDDEVYDFYKHHSNDEKRIYYYDDINNRFDYREFKTLKEFNEFCSEMGFLIDDASLNDLIFNYESHCCLDPTEKSEGNLIIISDRSYGGLSWSVSQDDGEYVFYS